MSTAVPSPTPLGSIPPSVRYSGSSASCISGIMDVDIQECFGPSTEVRGCSAEGGARGRHRTRSRSPQTREGQRQWAPAQRSIGSTAARQSLITRPHAGGESTGQIGAPTRNLHQGTETRYYMDHLPPAWPHELTLASVSGGATVEAESAKGSRRSATEKHAHHAPASSCACSSTCASYWEMAVPDMEPIIGSPGCGRKGPTPEQRCGGDVVQGDPSLGGPLHGQPFPCECGAQGDEQQGRLPVGDFQQGSRLPGCLASPGETPGPLSAPIDWHPDEARLAPSITSRGCSSEALFRIRQLKLSQCFCSFLAACYHTDRLHGTCCLWVPNSGLA